MDYLCLDQFVGKYYAISIYLTDVKMCCYFNSYDDKFIYIRDRAGSPLKRFLIRRIIDIFGSDGICWDQRSEQDRYIETFAYLESLENKYNLDDVDLDHTKHFCPVCKEPVCVCDDAVEHRDMYMYFISVERKPVQTLDTIYNAIVNRGAVFYISQYYKLMISDSFPEPGTYNKIGIYKDSKAISYINSPTVFIIAEREKKIFFCLIVGTIIEINFQDKIFRTISTPFCQKTISPEEVKEMSQGNFLKNVLRFLKKKLINMSCILTGLDEIQQMFEKRNQQKKAKLLTMQAVQDAVPLKNMKDLNGIIAAYIGSVPVERTD